MHSMKSLEVYIDLIHDKYHTLLELDITIFLVSFTCGKHLTMYILGDQKFIHFDSIRSIGLCYD